LLVINPHHFAYSKKANQQLNVGEFSAEVLIRFLFVHSFRVLMKSIDCFIFIFIFL